MSSSSPRTTPGRATGPGAPSRRGFLRGTGLVTAAALGLTGAQLSAGPLASAAPPNGRAVPRGRIGLGLYSVRDMLAADPEATLAMLADAGYREIEPAYDYGNRTPEQFRAIADANHLRVIGSHHNPDDFRGELAAPTMERAAILGQRWVGISYMDGEQTAASYRQQAAEMNEWGELAQQYGLRWYAHMHDYEFETDPDTGQILFDVWMEETDPDLVDFELDLYWILRAGVDPRPYLDAHEERFPLLHVKDGTPTEGIETDLGQGTVDFADIFSHLRRPATHHFLIERDQQPHPEQTARVSYDHLVQLRFDTLPPT